MSLDNSGMRELEDPLSDEDKDWLRNWNRADEIPGDEEEEEGEVESETYAGWSKAELRQEIQRRNTERDADNQMSLSGTKADLAARLEEDDAAE